MHVNVGSSRGALEGALTREHGLLTLVAVHRQVSQEEHANVAKLYRRVFDVPLAQLDKCATVDNDATCSRQQTTVACNVQHTTRGMQHARGPRNTQQATSDRSCRTVARWV